MKLFEIFRMEFLTTFRNYVIIHPDQWNVIYYYYLFNLVYKYGSPSVYLQVCFPTLGGDVTKLFTRGLVTIRGQPPKDGRSFQPLTLDAQLTTEDFLSEIFHHFNDFNNH